MLKIFSPFEVSFGISRQLRWMRPFVVAGEANQLSRKIAKCRKQLAVQMIYISCLFVTLKDNAF